MILVCKKPDKTDLVVNFDKFHSMMNDVVTLENKNTIHVAAGTTEEFAAHLRTNTDKCAFAGKLVSLVCEGD